MRTRESAAEPEIVVELQGRVAEDLPDYARKKIGAVLAHAGRPALHTRVRVVRHGNPGRERPVTAQVNIDLGGRLVRVQTDATTPREAVDLLVDRLRHRLERITLGRNGYRGRIDREQRHEAFLSLPPQEREIVRRKTVSPARRSVDEAVMDLDDLDHDFHLFREISRGMDSVVYRTGRDAVRLAQADGRTDLLAPTVMPITMSTHPAPRCTVSEAVERLRLTGLPFLFFVDAEQGRGCVLYHRYDGNYGLIEPRADA
ncbi:HPF/RaiA family ribosome-associated protein [Pseudonocardia hispaniensis]|uniref:HPF/RaiA family ribosome-associated protein n=1 Tax=Pseudonocardia hispaniensis TaxID=904933 RepID=A0ABW1IYA2_9PSEU